MVRVENFNEIYLILLIVLNFDLIAGPENFKRPLAGVSGANEFTTSF